MRSHMDASAVERVTATARERPGSPTARTGFADRAAAAQPEVPAWIAWMLDTAGEATTRFIYQCHYPLDRGFTTEDGVWGSAGKDSWIRNRALKAECAARGAFRAHLRGETGIFTANIPELPDDDAFYALRDGEEWTGHWYPRDPIDAPQWQLQ